MPSWFQDVYVGFSGLAFGMVSVGFFAIVAINRIERENERLRRLVSTVTEDVAK